MRMGINKFATSSGEVILESLDHLDCESTRRLISKAASKVAALSFQIPAFFFNDSRLFEARTARFPSCFIRSCATLSTDFPLVPVRKIIATSSASVRFCAPLKSNFSLGLSSSGRSLTPAITFPFFINCQIEIYLQAEKLHLCILQYLRTCLCASH